MSMAATASHFELFKGQNSMGPSAADVHFHPLWVQRAGLGVLKVNGPPIGLSPIEVC